MTARFGGWNHLPQGCFFHSGISGLCFNPPGYGLASCRAGGSEYCLCMSAPDCLHTDGAVANDATCFCGSTTCTVGSGFHCYESENFCHTGPPCLTTDGSVVNSGPCKCGKVRCTVATGLICYSDVGGDSCRTNDPGPYGYPMASSGLCADVIGRVPILDRSSCEAAARSLGKGQTSTATNSGAQGCQWVSDKALYTNTYNPCSWFD